ncbi:hypothetical protein D3C80_1529010 [compost metagenome]
MKLIGPTSTIDILKQYYKSSDGEITLTIKQEETRKRLEEAFTMLGNYHSMAEVQTILMKRHGCSKTQAWRYCNQAMSLFGNIIETNKNALRHFATETIREAIAMAKEQNNPVAMIMGAEKLAKINKVDEIDPDLPDFSHLESHEIKITIDPDITSALSGLLKKGTLDLDQLMNRVHHNASEAEIVNESNQTN